MDCGCRLGTWWLWRWTQGFQGEEGCGRSLRIGGVIRTLFSVYSAVGVPGGRNWKEKLKRKNESTSAEQRLWKPRFPKLEIWGRLLWQNPHKGGIWGFAQAEAWERWGNQSWSFCPLTLRWDLSEPWSSILGEIQYCLEYLVLRCQDTFTPVVNWGRNAAYKCTWIQLKKKKKPTRLNWRMDHYFVNLPKGFLVTAGNWFFLSHHYGW